MKKTAGILLIITSFLVLLMQLITIPNQLEYMYGIESLSIVIYPLSTIALIVLGFSLFNDNNSSNSKQIESSLTQDDLNPNDVPSTGLNIVSFLVPLVGLVIYLTEKDKAPKKAKSAGKAALWGTGISFLLGLISVIISFAMLSSISY